jgi:hypothetical protein
VHIRFCAVTRAVKHRPVVLITGSSHVQSGRQVGAVTGPGTSQVTFENLGGIKRNDITSMSLVVA